MHIHGVQMNPNLALNAAYAAQKAQAKREAEATRKKLFESTSELAGDGDFVMSIGAQQENYEGHSQRKNQQEKKSRNRSEKEGVITSHVSDWA